ncbi:hypothetical protein OGAPHI_004151 [Ogataea philodendri]|uniref:Thioredoxin domain-containing protein n=3 Tax=Saccharomycotina TaxID=147537 RepID=A0A9P8P636_9ASCO|nr:uncharacterized protein OGAPHI_004151 [Ogataea philodendri]KAH3665962.1 hypothetical protein OGAPHI_004151 [Ogataea philodendri]
MRSILAGLFLLIGLTLAYIVEVDDRDFEDVVFGQPGKYSFVYFYSPGCIHCQNLDPQFEPLGNLFHETNLQIVKVNGKANSRLRSKFQLIGFPTLKLFSFEGDDIGAYTGLRTTHKMVEYLRDATGVQPRYPPRSVVDVSSSNIDQTIHKHTDKDVVLAFAAPWIDGWDDPHSSYYERLAQYYSDKVKDGTIFGLVDISKAENNQLISRFQVTKYPTVFHFPKDRSDNENIFKLDHDVGPEEIVSLLMGTDSGQTSFVVGGSGIDYTEESDLEDDTIDIQFRDL